MSQTDFALSLEFRRLLPSAMGREIGASVISAASRHARSALTGQHVPPRITAITWPWASWSVLLRLDRNSQSVLGFLDFGDVERHQFGAAKRPREAQQEWRKSRTPLRIATTCRALAAKQARSRPREKSRHDVAPVRNAYRRDLAPRLIYRATSCCPEGGTASPGVGFAGTHFGVASRRSASGNAL